jgi:hypothetical protein
MNTNPRTELVTRLANRGLTLKSFDGHVLTVHYDAEADTEVNLGHIVDVQAVSRYLRYVITDVPGSDQMFPGLQDVEVEYSATE